MIWHAIVWDIWKIRNDSIFVHKSYFCWSGEDQASLVGLDFGQDKNPTPHVYSTSGVLILFTIFDNSIFFLGVGMLL
jgi:hypothetical protein